MPICTMTGGFVVNAFNESRFLGFKRLPSQSLVGVFKVDGMPMQVTKLYREPIDIRMLNELREAAGLSPLLTNRKVVLPMVGDRNMLGYNKRMKVFLILKENGFYDITDVRHISDEPQEEVSFDPETGEILEYSSIAA